MNVKEVGHWTIGSATNLLMIIFLVKTAWDGNDKAIILVIFYYLAIVILNILVWLVLKFIGKREASIYGTLVLCLLILFIPVLFISSLY